MKRFAPHIFTSNKRVSLWIIVLFFGICALLFHQLTRLDILLNPIARYIKIETEQNGFGNEIGLLGVFFELGESRETVIKKLRAKGYGEVYFFSSIASRKQSAELPPRKNKPGKKMSFFKPDPQPKLQLTISKISENCQTNTNKCDLEFFSPGLFIPNSFLGWGMDRELSFVKPITRLPKCKYQVVNVKFDKKEELVESVGAMFSPKRRNHCSPFWKDKNANN